MEEKTFDPRKDFSARFVANKRRVRRVELEMFVFEKFDAIVNCHANFVGFVFSSQFGWQKAITSLAATT